MTLIASRAYGKEPTRNETLTLWHTLDDRHAKFFATEIIAPFEKAHAIAVKLESGMDVRASLLTGREKGMLPDIVLAPWDIIALADVVPFAEVADMPPGLNDRDLETVRWQKKQYAVPVLSGNHLVLYYNKAFVKKPATSWEELAEQQKALAAGNVDLLAIDYGVPYTFSAFLATFGTLPVDDAARPQLATEACAKALEYYRNLSRKGLVKENCDYRCTTKDFFAGKYAYSLHGDWAFHDAKAALGANLGIASLPAIGKTAMRSLRGSHALFFPRANFAKKKSAIRALAKYLIAAKTQTLWAEKGYRIPANKASYEALKTTAPAEYASLVHQLDRAVPLPNGPGVALMWPALKRGMDIYFADIKDAKTTCADMQKQAERGLDPR